MILRIYGTDVSLYDSFGVTKRTGFKCIIEWVEGDRWKLIDLDLTDLGCEVMPIGPSPGRVIMAQGLQHVRSPTCL